MTPPIRAAIFDIDGTLARTRQKLTGEMQELLADLVAKMPVGIISGGSYAAQFDHQVIEGLLPRTDRSQLILFPTGSAECYLWNRDAWKKEYSFAFTTEEKQRILQALDETLAETAIVDLAAETYGPRLQDRNTQITWSALGEAAPPDVKEPWDPDHAKRDSFRAILAKKIPDFEIQIGGTTSIDINRKGIDKAYGVRWLEKRLGIPVGEMVYVGDALFPGGNDALVIPTGVQTHAVKNPADTTVFIKTLLSH